MEINLQDEMNNQRNFTIHNSTMHGKMFVNERLSPPEVMVIFIENGQKIEPIIKHPIKRYEVGQYLVGDEPAASLISKVLDGLDR